MKWTPEKEERFLDMWLKQNRQDVIDRPTVAKYHNQELLISSARKKQGPYEHQSERRSRRAEQINALLLKDLDIETISEVLAITQATCINIINRNNLPIEGTSP